MSLSFIPLTLPSSVDRDKFKDFGKEVKGVHPGELTCEDFEKIEHALYQHDLLLFRNVDLTPTQQYALVKAFDPKSETYGHGNNVVDKTKSSILSGYINTLPRVPQIQVIGHGVVRDHEGIPDITLKHGRHSEFHATKVSEEDEAKGFTRFFRWHLDAALYDLRPPKVSTLYGIKVPKGPRQTVRYEDGSDDELSVTLGTTAFVSCKTMFEILPPEMKSLAVRARAKYAPHPFLWMRNARAVPTGLGLETQGLELPFNELPPWREEKIKIYPFVWKNPVTNALHLMVHPCAIVEMQIDPLPEGSNHEGAVCPLGATLTDFKEIRELVYKMQRPGISPNLVYPHPWEEKDLVLWNNRGLFHSVISEARARKKSKTDSSKSKQNATKSNQNNAIAGKPSSPFSTTLIVIPILLAISVYVYLNPTILINFLDEYIGFSEHYDGAPEAYQPKLTYLPADIEKRDAVVQAFRHSWNAYEKNAMGADEYHPLGQKGSDLSTAGGIGFMVVDVIDTLQIMGLKDEYSRARQWVAEKLTFERDGLFSTFETTIRVLGGLLSAYHLSGGDRLYLEKATELADRILPVFETASGLPLPVVNLAERKGYHTTDFPGVSSIAEVGTLQLEFRYLSHLTGNYDYWRAVERVMGVIKQARLPHGLASVFMNIESGQYETSVIRLGSRGDSFYEYLLKQHLQTNNTENVYREMYEDAMDAVHAHLIQKSMGNKMTYTSELVPEDDANGDLTWRLTPKQDHLVCFLGGSLMLGATRTGALVRNVSIPPRAEELSEKGLRDWKTGVELVKTCMHTHDTATGLSPEIVYFRVPSDGMDALPHAPPDWYIRGAAVGEFPPYDARYMLRPETVESLFIAYRLTGDQRYRDHGWGIFRSIEKHCRVEAGGYATIINVDENPARQEDKMETFFLSETLKYLYLLFSDSDLIPLDQTVFNTEAHPFPIFNPSITGRDTKL